MVHLPSASICSLERTLLSASGRVYSSGTSLAYASHRSTINFRHDLSYRSVTIHGRMVVGPLLNSPGHSNMRRRGGAAGRPRRLGLFRMGRRRKKEGQAKVLRCSKYTAHGNGPKPHARPNQHGSDPLSCPIAGEREHAAVPNAAVAAAWRGGSHAPKEGGRPRSHRAQRESRAAEQREQPCRMQRPRRHSVAEATQPPDEGGCPRSHKAQRKTRAAEQREQPC